MVNKELNVRIKHKRDSEDNWSTNNPILLNGEIIFVDLSDGGLKIKVGDGTSTYSALPFLDFIPTYTTNDNNKILSIVNGEPTWITSTLSYQIQQITQDEYDALTEKDSNTLYIIEV